MEGLGQLANHTCCDIHWNANLEVAAIAHYEETEILPMGFLRARKDIGKDTEILTRYWHKEKDAWQNIFECECCACTNHTGNTTNPPATADMTVIDDTVSIADHTPREKQDLEMPDHELNQDHSARKKQEYPESEMDDWDWDELEASHFKGTTTPIQLPTELLPLTKTQGVEGGIRQDDYQDQEVDTLDWEVLEHPPDRDTKTKLDNMSRPPLNPSCEQRQAHWFLCQDKFRCKNSMPNLGGKTRIIQDYGLRIGKVDLISNTHIAIGEIAAVFGETSTVWDQDDVDEFDCIATLQNTMGNAQQFDFYVSGNAPGNQGHFHIIPKVDAELALSMENNPPLRRSLQNRSIWKGEGQHAKHTCCKRHQNVELQFTTVQTRQEDDFGNGLSPGKTDMAAVLRATREIQPGESIRYQHVDHSEQIGNTPKCECCLHIGLCQPQEKETMLERMALVPTQSSSETWQPKIGAPVTVYTGGDAQKWRVNHIKQGIAT